ncbi:MAG: hypothetical protein JRD69_04975 [Deltaproteobacteria bacterium]|nr:hypothetical protein [Deltaproteobacteria bacterium]
MLETQEVMVYFAKPLEAPAREILSIYPKVKGELEKMLGWQMGYRPNVLLIKDRDKFEKMTGSNLFVAMAIPQKKLVIIDYSRMIQPFTLRTTLKHELCHLILHHHIKDGALPRWLDEGVAQWASDGMGEIIMKSDRFILNRAALTHRYIPLEDLSHYFPRDENALLLAYEEGKSIVEYIIGEYGTRRMLQVLYDLEDDQDLNTAISNGLFISLHELEAQWHKHLKQQISWLLFLNAYFYQILFFLTALLLAVVGSAKLLKRRRDRLNEYEEDDEENPSV